DSVDAVFAEEALHWFDDDQSLAEIARVLRARAALVLLWNVPARPWEPSIASAEALLRKRSCTACSNNPGSCQSTGTAASSSFPLALVPAACSSWRSAPPDPGRAEGNERRHDCVRQLLATTAERRWVAIALSKAARRGRRPGARRRSRIRRVPEPSRTGRRWILTSSTSPARSSCWPIPALKTSTSLVPAATRARSTASSGLVTKV